MADLNLIAALLGGTAAVGIIAWEVRRKLPKFRRLEVTSDDKAFYDDYIRTLHDADLFQPEDEPFYEDNPVCTCNTDQIGPDPECPIHGKRSRFHSGGVIQPKTTGDIPMIDLGGERLIPLEQAERMRDRFRAKYRYYDAWGKEIEPIEITVTPEEAARIQYKVFKAVGLCNREDGACVTPNGCMDQKRCLAIRPSAADKWTACPGDDYPDPACGAPAFDDVYDGTTGDTYQGEPAKVPPNMGGIGNPKYEGPNYITDEDMAQALKTVPHYFDKPAEVIPINVNRDDLTVEFKAGHVALDGCIWLDPTHRACLGLVQIPWEERHKAFRFGWHFHSDGTAPGFIKVIRHDIPVTR